YVDPRDESVIPLHGFFRNLAGQVTRLDPPGSIRTQAGFLNAQGQVVGVYRDASNTRHGFVWQAGAFTTFDEPDAKTPEGTVPLGINDRGQIVRDYVDRHDFIRHGFLLSAGVYTRIDAAGAVVTVAEGINNAGEIAGLYFDGSFNEHGFVLPAGGHLPITVDFPNRLSTGIFSINALGEMVGQYENPSGVFHGFVGRPVQ